VLKIRVMPTLLYRDYGLVKGVGFDSWRQIGSAMQAMKVYSLRGVDEIVFLDITATREKRDPDYGLIRDLADECFMPLTVGGGVHRLDQVRQLLRAGADKVAVNTAAVEHPELITEIAEQYGSQCVIVSIDALRRGGGAHEVVIRSGTEPTGLDPVMLARRAAAAGAGEILLTSVERDGTMRGFDLDLIRAVTAAVGIPVIASGGAGSADDAAAVITAGASAVAAAAMFHFTEITPAEVKEHLRSRGFAVRQ
jgi:cyclase